MKIMKMAQKQSFCTNLLVPVYAYFTPQLKTNNYGFINGTNGNRKIEIPKPKNLIRINCIGGSTTGNYVSLNNHIYSYPLELEKILNLKSSKK